MRKLSWLLAVVMLFGCVGSAIAEQQYFNGNTTTQLVDPDHLQQTLYGERNHR